MGRWLKAASSWVRDGDAGEGAGLLWKGLESCARPVGTDRCGRKLGPRTMPPIASRISAARADAVRAAELLFKGGARLLQYRHKGFFGQKHWIECSKIAALRNGERTQQGVSSCNVANSSA